MPYTQSIVCLNCGITKLQRNGMGKYCSNKCQGEYRRKKATEEWLKTGQNFPRYGIKEHILVEQNKKCAICHVSNIWNEQTLIFILDHIDGNSNNNNRSNLRCVCPNCDSQLPTFKSRNRGNGRHLRRIRYKEGKSY